MTPWLISWIMFCAFGLVLPTILLLVGWRRRAESAPLVMIPAIAIVILALSMIHDIRWVLIGADYTRRHFITIYVFAAMTLVNAVFAVVRRVWSIGVASALLSLAWFYLGVVNSVV